MGQKTTFPINLLSCIFLLTINGALSMATFLKNISVSLAYPGERNNSRRRGLLAFEAGAKCELVRPACLPPFSIPLCPFVIIVFPAEIDVHRRRRLT